MWRSRSVALREQGRLSYYFIENLLFVDGSTFPPDSPQSSFVLSHTQFLKAMCICEELSLGRTSAFHKTCLPTFRTGWYSWAGFLSFLNACWAYISQGNTSKRCVNLDGKGAPGTPVTVQTVGWIFCVHFKLFKLIKHWNTRSEMKNESYLLFFGAFYFA